MSEKFRNIFRIPSVRLQHWDYGWNAAYFVTICTRQREYFFGDVDGKGVMQLSEVGKIAQQYLQEIPAHFSYAKLDISIVMPNHVHGIIIIDKPNGRISKSKNEIDQVFKPTLDVIESSSSNSTGGVTGSNNPMLHDNLSRTIRWYKGRVTFESQNIFNGFAWQSRFHEHIIRDEKSYRLIYDYILNNPLKWKEDKFYIKPS